jgi:hypothetical protein
MFELTSARGIRWTRPTYNDIAVYRLESLAEMDEFVGAKQ